MSKELKKKDTSCINDKLINSLKLIESLSNTLGISKKDRVLFDIEEVDQNELRIRIKNGSLNYKTPWFAIKNEEPYVFMPAEILDIVLKMLKNAQRESFELKLERSIWQHFPVDFGDVWRVAMEELSKQKFVQEPDLDKVIEKIKREHPNLFVDMANLLEMQRNNDD